MKSEEGTVRGRWTTGNCDRSETHETPTVKGKDDAPNERQERPGWQVGDMQSGH